MKTSFIRGLWGVPKQDAITRRTQDRYLIIPEVSNWKRDLGIIPFITYVFGTQNKEFLQGLGIEPIVISNNPIEWDVENNSWRHKLEIIRVALQEYEKIVWLDWDCYPKASLPNNFWDKISQGMQYKACLKMHKRPCCNWREDSEAKRYIPSGSFIYIGDQKFGDRLIDCYKKTVPTDEHAAAFLADELLGGWKGPHEYYRFFEPYCAQVRRCSFYPGDTAQKKEILFYHR